jgi:hypothetical protein
MIVAVSIDARVLRTTAGVDAADVPPEVGRAFDETYPSARASHIEKRQNYRGVTYEITFGWQNGTWRATFTDRGRLLSAVANVEPITAPARSRSAVRSTRRCLPCG